MTLTESELQVILSRGHVKEHGKAAVKVDASVIPTEKSKYRSQKVYTDEGTFDSKKEYGRFQQLKMLQDAGQIFDLQRQVTFHLLGPEKLLGEKRTKPALRYIADFIYVTGGRLVVEDTKSEKTRALQPYRIKKHIMKSRLNLDILET